MIKDAKGRKWFLRFKQSSNGWHWRARHENLGREAGIVFPTKGLARNDAYRVIAGRDVIAEKQEYWRSIVKHELTANERKAISGLCSR
jgi:hypothetical protein